MRDSAPREPTPLSSTMPLPWPPALILLFPLGALAAEPKAPLAEAASSTSPQERAGTESHEVAAQVEPDPFAARAKEDSTGSLESAVSDQTTDDQTTDDQTTDDQTTSAALPCAPSPRRFAALALVEGLAHYGGVSRGEDLSDPDAARETYRAGLVGGQMTMGVMPGGRHFTMAGRIRGGAYLGGGTQVGTMGAAMLFGANFLRDTGGRSFGYVLGGVGIEFLPGSNQDMLTLHVAGGTIVRGFNFSAGLDLGGNDEVAHAMIGFQLGWGQLF